MKSAEDLKRRAEITFKARANAERRVRITGRSWSYALVFSSTLVLIGSILAIQDPELFSPLTPSLLAAASALVLIQSVVVSRTDYDGRAKLLKESFIACKGIASQLELLIESPGGTSAERVADLESDYARAQSGSENHEGRDYSRVLTENPRLRLEHDNTVRAIATHRFRVAVSMPGPYLPWLMPLAILGAGVLGLAA